MRCNLKWTAVTALAAVLGGIASAEEPLPATYLYVHDKGTGSIQGFSVSGNDITPLAGFPVAEPGTPSATGAQVQSMVYLPSRHLLFTTCSEGVNVYDVQSGGSLVSVAGSPFGPGSGGFEGVGVVESKKGIGVYALSRSNAEIRGFTVDEAGALVATPGSPYPLSTEDAYGLCALGKAVFVPGYGDDTFESYKVVKDFDLKRTKSTATGAANYFAFPDPKGKFLFSNSYDQTSDQVYALKVSKGSGKFKAVKGSPFSMGEGADLGSDLVVGEDGIAVGLSYSSNTAQAMVYDKKGGFLALGGSQNVSLSGSKVGRFLPGSGALCIACDTTDDVRVFTLDRATGTLELVDIENVGNFNHSFNGIVVVTR